MKSSKTRTLYLIGLALVAVGFCLPIVQGKMFGSTSNGFSVASDYFNGDRTFLGICAYVTFIAAVVGIVQMFFCNKMLYDVICLALSIVGGLVFYFNMSGVTKSFGKAIFNPGVGLYLMIGGWVLGLIGFILSLKDYK